MAADAAQGSRLFYLHHLMVMLLKFVMSIVSYYEFEIATLVFGLPTQTPTSSTDSAKYFNLIFKLHFLSFTQTWCVIKRVRVSIGHCYCDEF